MSILFWNFKKKMGFLLHGFPDVAARNLSSSPRDDFVVMSSGLSAAAGSLLIPNEPGLELEHVVRRSFAWLWMRL